MRLELDVKRSLLKSQQLVMMRSGRRQHSRQDFEFREGDSLVSYKKHILKNAYENGRAPGNLLGLGRVVRDALGSTGLRREGIQAGPQRHKDDQAEDIVDALLHDAVISCDGAARPDQHEDVLGDPNARLQRVVFVLADENLLVVETGGANYRGWDPERLDRSKVKAAAHAALPRRTPEEERIAQLEAKIKTLQARLKANAKEDASSKDTQPNTVD